MSKLSHSKYYYHYSLLYLQGKNTLPVFTLCYFFVLDGFPVSIFVAPKNKTDTLYFPHVTSLGGLGFGSSCGGLCDTVEVFSV